MIDRVKELAKHFVIYGIGNAAQSATAFILLPILTARFSKAEYGEYSLILMVATMASAVFYFGMTTAIPRSYFEYEDVNERKAVYSTALYILLAGATLQILFGYFLSDFVSIILFGEVKEGQSQAIFFAFLGGAVAIVNHFFFMQLRLLRRSIMVTLLSIVSLILGVGLTLILLEIRGNNLRTAFEGILYSQICVSIIYLSIAGRNSIVLKIHKAEIAPLIRFGFYSGVLASFGALVLEWSDRIIIERILGATDLGLYSALFKASALLGVLLVVPFANIWSPMMMEYKKDANIKHFFRMVLNYYLLFGLLIISFLAVYIDNLLPLIISFEITQSDLLIFMVLSCSVLIYSTVNITVAGLVYERKTHQVAIVYYVMAIIKITLNIFMINFLGIIGAAFSTLLIAIILPIIMYNLSAKYFNFSIDWKLISKLFCIMIFLLIYSYIAPWWPLLNQYYIEPFIVLIMWISIYNMCISSIDRQNITTFVKNIPTLLKGQREGS